MTEFRALTADELQPILDLLTGLPEHTPLDELPNIVARLGWTLQSKRIGWTNLPVSFRMLRVGSLDGPEGAAEIVSFNFRVTDTLPAKGDANREIVSAAFPGIVAAVERCLDLGPTRKMWTDTGETWDLPDGKQVNVYQADNMIALEVWAKERADIERHEISHGVDPAHNLDDRPW